MPYKVIGGFFAPTVEGSYCAGGDCNRFGPQKAIDGVTSGLESLASTRYAFQPSMTFELDQARSDITSIAFVARSDTALEQSTGITVYVAPTATTNTNAGAVVCGVNVSATKLGEKVYVPCPVTANVKFVTLQRMSTGWIQIQEIMVYHDGECMRG